MAGPILRVYEPKKASARCLQYIGFSKIRKNVGTALPSPSHTSFPFSYPPYFLANSPSCGRVVFPHLIYEMTLLEEFKEEVLRILSDLDERTFVSPP